MISTYFLLLLLFSITEAPCPLKGQPSIHRNPGRKSRGTSDPDAGAGGGLGGNRGPVTNYRGLLN